MSERESALNKDKEEQPTSYPVASVTKKSKGVKREAKELTEEQEDSLDKISDWFERDKQAKQFYTDEMAEMHKLYIGEHWDLLGPDGNVLRTPNQKANRPNAIENITFAMIEGLVAEFAQDIELIDYPVEAGDDDVAKLMTALKKHITYKNRLATQQLKWLRWMFTYGTGIWTVYWDQTWMGGKGKNRWLGDIRWHALHPAMLFPDARCREDINEGYRCHKAVYRPLEYIYENYPERGYQVEEEFMRDDAFAISNPEDDDGEDGDWKSGEDRAGQALLVETWYRGRPLFLGEGEEDKGNGLHVVWWAGEDNPVYLKHANYIYYEPGETPKFPFVVKQRYPRENSVWGYGECYYLKNPQIVQNKTVEIILEGHMQQAIGQTFYEPSGMTKAQLDFIEENGSIPGAWFPMLSIASVKREHGSGVPASLLSDVDRRQKVMETITGRFDISQGRTPGSVTAFRALNLLASRAASRLKTTEQTIKEAYEDSGNAINRLITQFYNERRAYRIIGTGQSAPATFGEFRPSAIKKVWIKGPISDTVPYEQFTPEPGMQEELDYEVYCPEMDTQCYITQAMPTDRMFYLELAKELFGMQLITPDILWHVMAEGRFPPWEMVAATMNKLFGTAQAEKAVQSGIMDQKPLGDDVTAAIQSLPPDMQDQLMALPPEEREAALAEYMATLQAQGGEVQGAPNR